MHMHDVGRRAAGVTFHGAQQPTRGRRAVLMAEVFILHPHPPHLGQAIHAGEQTVGRPALQARDQIGQLAGSDHPDSRLAQFAQVAIGRRDRRLAEHRHPHPSPPHGDGDVGDVALHAPEPVEPPDDEVDARRGRDGSPARRLLVGRLGRHCRRCADPATVPGGRRLSQVREVGLRPVLGRPVHAFRHPLLRRIVAVDDGRVRTGQDEQRAGRERLYRPGADELLIDTVNRTRNRRQGRQ